MLTEKKKREDNYFVNIQNIRTNNKSFYYFLLHIQKRIIIVNEKKIFI